MTQKEIFLKGEGDAWLTRNSDALSKQLLPDSDPLLVELLSLQQQPGALPVGCKVLEIGCGSGARLAWLQQHMELECHGIKPSDLAVKQANAAGVRAQVGTADQLAFEDKFFDVVIFGFCLYLCDRDDLFKIAAEADRVLKNPGWLLIKDFHSPAPSARTYHHKAGLFSYKMDYKTLFSWNPDYNVYSNRVTHHHNGSYTDDRQEWVATSVLRKCRQL